MTKPPDQHEAEVLAAEQLRLRRELNEVKDALATERQKNELNDREIDRIYTEMGLRRAARKGS